MNAVQSYLQVSGDYVDCLRWNVTENVLEYSDGGAQFAFAEEIAEFLEGFAGQRRLIHFGLLMHMLQLLRWTTSPTDLLNPNRRRLWDLFKKHGKSLRHAGAFRAQLCRDVPVAVPRPSGGGNRPTAAAPRHHHSLVLARPIRTTSTPAGGAPLFAAGIRDAHLARTGRLQRRRGAAWLEHGCWPVKEARKPWPANCPSA